MHPRSRLALAALVLAPPCLAQPRLVGRVLSDSAPIVGAEVSITAWGASTTTDARGWFSFQLPASARPRQPLARGSVNHPYDCRGATTSGRAAGMLLGERTALPWLGANVSIHGSRPPPGASRDAGAVQDIPALSIRSDGRDPAIVEIPAEGDTVLVHLGRSSSLPDTTSPASMSDSVAWGVRHGAPIAEFGRGMGARIEVRNPQGFGLIGSTRPSIPERSLRIRVSIASITPGATVVVKLHDERGKPYWGGEDIRILDSAGMAGTWSRTLPLGVRDFLHSLGSPGNIQIGIEGPPGSHATISAIAFEGRTGRTAYLLDAGTLPDGLYASAVALQGIANRLAPNVLLYSGRHNAMLGSDQSNWDTLVARFPDPFARLDDLDQAWVDWYAREHGIHWVELPDIDALGDLVSDRIKGALLVGSPSLLAPACSRGAADDLLPVTDMPDDTYRASRFLAGLPILDTLSESRFADGLAATRWAWSLVGPRTNRREMAAEPTPPSLDLVYSEHLFATHLNDASPEGAAFLSERVAELDLPRIVHGWGSSEWRILSTVSTAGGMVLCSQSTNLSFHRRVHARRPDLKQAVKRDPRTKLEDRVYVTMTVAEGDTPKFLSSFQGGAWLQPRRGEFPINWGTATSLFEMFPVFREYYYGTATANDLFLSSVSGHGYTFPWMNPSIAWFVDREAQLAPEQDLSWASVLVPSLVQSGEAWKAPSWNLPAWLDARGMRGYLWDGAAAEGTDVRDSLGFVTQWTPGGRPLVGTDWHAYYWWCMGQYPKGTWLWRHKIPDLAAWMIDTFEKTSGPKFVSVYSGDPQTFGALCDSLRSHPRFRVVLADEYLQLRKFAEDSSWLP